MFVSYIVSGVAITLAAVCYAEFAMEYPVSGAGFTYIMLTFGELPAWIAVANLMLEYVLGSAAVRGGGWHCRAGAAAEGHGCAAGAAHGCRRRRGGGWQRALCAPFALRPCRVAHIESA